MLTLSDLQPYARYVLEAAEIPELPCYYRGKVRDNYDLPDGRRLLIASDRISAFDQSLAAIPLKGQVLTQTARFWFEATRDICPDHVLDYPDPNVLLCRRLAMMPVEVVVRRYLAGATSTSILQMYRNGARRLYGYDFPEGMKDNPKLPQAILTPTTKGAHGAHDEPLSGEDIVSRGLLTETQWRDVSRLALALFARGNELAAKRGLILADTKYEFGFDDKGGIVLGDEIHTPDSSRYWLAETYPAKFAAGGAPILSIRISSAVGFQRVAIPIETPFPKSRRMCCYKRRLSISRRTRKLRERLSSCPIFPCRLWSVSGRIWGNLCHRAHNNLAPGPRNDLSALK